MRRWPLLALLALPLTTCAGRWDGSTAPIRSQVVDARTGQPVGGAVVLGVWHRLAGVPGLTYHRLVGVQEVETDIQGRFELQPPQGWFGEYNESITVYKFGYIAWNNLQIFRDGRRQDTTIPPRITLEPFPARGDRRRHFDFIGGAASTHSYGYEAAPKFKNAIEEEIRRR